MFWRPCFSPSPRDHSPHILPSVTSQQLTEKLPCGALKHSLLPGSTPQQCASYFLAEQTETQRGNPMPKVTQHVRDSAGTRSSLSDCGLSFLPRVPHWLVWDPYGSEFNQETETTP